ncbi:uncharacterized protein LOC118437609 [Folsomia candida]|uniref:uncharacterized protein LOC118437609 n=1 Tax=Folsomia candida TaxID=158441 RepID=UPI001604B15A|nr:uncharacterized protein LOC118437609 [Folsomia candida]
MLWWFSPCGGLCQLEARDQQNQSKRINFAILSCKIKFTPKWVILLKKFSRLQGWWNSSQHSKVKLNCKSVLINLIIFFFNLADQDVDENVLRKLPDCQVGSLEERLLADIVPSIGRRLKIINAIREVAAKSSEQQLASRDEENMYKLVLINNEETFSQSNNNFEQESICSVNISEGDKCLSLSDQLFVSNEVTIWMVT